MPMPPPIAPPIPSPIPSPPPRASRAASRAALAAALLLALAGCAGGGAPRPALDDGALLEGWRLETFRGEDDLLTGGLGAEGLRAAAPPAFADPDAPSAAELRRRALWTNWRGIVDLAPRADDAARFAPVPGREFSALLALPGARAPHRVLVQVPDGWAASPGCLVVTASSGSRGVYGAIGSAGAWALRRGCAVAYTDKGAGTDYVTLADGEGVRLDGRRATPPDGGVLGFSPLREGAAASNQVAVKHAHSGDNPEADWGRHLHQAARAARDVLALAHPEAEVPALEDLRVIAYGLSNGGGAVLRAVERGEGARGDAPAREWLDGVVAVAPQVWPAAAPGVPTSRALFDYASEAALLQPCALLAPAFADAPSLLPPAVARAQGEARCASLAAAGMVDGNTLEARAADAAARLRAGGLDDAAMGAGALSTGLDLWRSVLVTYAAAYARTGTGPMPCGFGIVVADAAGARRAPSAAERAAWWSDASGIPPGAGLAIADARAVGADPAFAGLACLRGLWTGAGEALDARAGEALRAGVAATRAAPPRPGVPVLVVHGRDDGLVPAALTGRAWVASARAHGADAVRYWEVEDAQHFDAFLGVPALRARFGPLLPHGEAALDALWAHLEAGAALPGDARRQAR